MMRRRGSSRQRFETYRKEQVLKRKTDEAPVSPHGSPSRIKSGPRMRSAKTLIREFFFLIREQKWLVIFALSTLTVATLLALIPPAATKFLIDYVLVGKPIPATVPFSKYWSDDRWTLLVTICVGVLILSIFKSCIHLWGRWYATLATKRVQLSVRKQVFDHAVRLPLNRVQELRSGGVASILREDAGSVANLIFGLLYNPWRAIIQLVGSLCVLAWVDWRLLMGALILIPVFYFTHRTWITRIRPQFRAVRATREETDAQATEAFGGMRVVRAFSRQRRESRRFMGNNNYMARQELYTWWWSRVVELIWELLIPIATTALMLYCGWQVLEGQLTLGDVMMFGVYLLMLLEPLAILAQSATQFQNSLSGLDRVLDLLEEPREMVAAPGSLSLAPSQVKGELQFENVSFSYPGVEAQALIDASFSAKPGQTIALVGHSGAGKTTLCNLVARFYDPSKGRILLDGQELTSIEVESYRGLLGVVEQDVFLFDGSVAENIAYANPQATDESIIHAAEIANAQEFIVDLPDGYNTIIGERGVKLSGGQRQRLAIARAILADPKILILDEATSNLDTESERLIQQSMNTLMSGRTNFVIAHRLSTITHADLILVLENGRIIERGTHEELLQRDGRYSEMVQLQVSEPKVEM